MDTLRVRFLVTAQMPGNGLHEEYEVFSEKLQTHQIVDHLWKGMSLGIFASSSTPLAY